MTERVEAEVVRFGLPREVTPTQALKEELDRTAGLIQFYGMKLDDLDEDEIAGSPLVKLHAEERKHFADVAKTCIAVGIEARRIELAEEQGRQIMQVLKGVMLDLGVWDNPEAAGIVRKHLSVAVAA